MALTDLFNARLPKRSICEKKPTHTHSKEKCSKMRYTCMCLNIAFCENPSFWGQGNFLIDVYYTLFEINQSINQSIKVAFV